MNFEKKKGWSIKSTFAKEHLHAPYEWITFMPINTSETCHNPEIYQVFHSDFQSVMSFILFSLNSLHAGSILHILGIQVSDAVDRRRTIQRGSGFQTALLRGQIFLWSMPWFFPTSWPGWLCNMNQGENRSYSVVGSLSGMCENVCGVCGISIWITALKCWRKRFFRICSGQCL